MKKKQHSLSAKTINSTVISCIIFGLIIQIVALSFFAVSITKQYIQTADTTVRQVRMSVKHSVDSADYFDQVIETYRSLSNEQREMVGSAEYRQFFSGIDTESKGGVYDVLLHMLEGTLSFHTQNDISDVYVAMYDRETSAMVYLIDPDKETNRLMPGDWESVSAKGMMKFLNGKDDEIIYDIDWTRNYGLLCTVGVPVENDQGKTNAFVLADISLDNILVGMREFGIRLAVSTIAITILIAWLQTKRIKRALVAPIIKITEASRQFASGRTDGKRCFADLNINSGDEIEDLAKTMEAMENNLYEYGDNLLKITKEKERIGTELELARKIQSNMLPNIFPPFPDRPEFDIFASMIPAKEVGGDFYDFFLIDSDHLGMVMADVSGKGIPAALFMMVAKILIYNFAMQGSSPAKVLEQTNSVICQNNSEEMFVTVWFGVLEISTGKVTSANAGHEYPVIKKADGSYELLRDKHGFVIGGMDGIKYKEYEIQLEKGGGLFLYTDGVPEATNSSNELFGLGRMLNAMNGSDCKDPEELLETVKKAVDSFVGDAEQFDDLTMLGLSIR